MAHVKRTVREYLADLEQENPIEEPAHQQDQVSTTDPDSTYSTKGARMYRSKIALTSFTLTSK